MSKLIKKEVGTILKKLTKLKNVNSIQLFGSQITGKTGPLSDIDVCIGGKISSSEKLNILSLFSEDYDISFLEDLYPWVAVRVFEGGKVLYVKDKSEFYKTVFRKIRQYEEISQILKRRTIEKFGKWQI